MVNNKSVIERLKAYGFNPAKMKDSDVMIINSALIAYANGHNTKTVIAKILEIANKYYFTLNAALLNSVHKSINEKPIISKPEKKKPIINIIPVKHEIVNREYTAKQSSAIAKKYQERKINIVNKTQILCTCLICEITAMNERDLKLIFGVNMIDRKIKMICLDCE